MSFPRLKRAMFEWLMPGAIGVALLSAPVSAWLPPPAIFFDHDSSELSDQARRILDSIAESYSSGGERSISIFAHADRSGDRNYNRELSCRRARAVRDYLVRSGIPAEVVTMDGYGEERPQVNTPDGVAEPQNRRADVEPGSGVSWNSRRDRPC